jgi:hypothetical protein
MEVTCGESGICIGFSFSGDDFDCSSDCVVTTFTVEGEEGDEVCISDVILSNHEGEIATSITEDCAELSFCDIGSGDANFDGELNVLDIVLIVNEIVDPQLDTDSCEYMVMDANADGSVNVLDIVVFVGLIVG